ncbi:PREDICTED: protein PSY3-like [Camelina sativa]|uniref:Protein PSY3-like n=1 Tax=Camelina sativa TaxID=90675 RepID=A0ABM1R798_CAMSA|nr:PREDICTED: protein PSY3-like [Camelina sativa]
MGYCYTIRLCLCIFFALSIVSSARITLSSFSENEKMVERGRSLMVSTNDYDKPSANARHNPPGRRGGGRRRRG